MGGGCVVPVLGGDARFLAPLLHYIYPLRHLHDHAAAPRGPRAVCSLRRAAVQAAAPGAAAAGGLPPLLHGSGVLLSPRRRLPARLLSCRRQGGLLYSTAKLYILGVFFLHMHGGTHRIYFK